MVAQKCLGSTTLIIINKFKSKQTDYHTFQQTIIVHSNNNNYYK